MKEIDFYIADVFAKNRYGGNQLAVFIDLEDELGNEEMLKIAREINFAESTFIKKKISTNRYQVKIYTTESEIPFAGHPTIGTSYIIAKYLIKKITKEVILELLVGDIVVTLSNSEELDSCLFKMTQSQPEFLQTFSKKEISAQLAIEETLITDNNTIQEVSTGLPFIVIPIIDLESIGKIQLDAINFKRFLIKNKIYKSNNINKLSTSLLFFTKQSYEADNDYNVRMFCLEDDILKEDSATGSANGCFLAYLLNYVEDKIDVSVEQGFQMNRKSYLYLEGQKSEDKYDIKVGGHSKIVAMGKWKIQA